MTKLLIKDIEAFLPNGQVQKTNIAIEDTKIVAVGDGAANWSADRIIDGKNKLAVPGLVNTHTHAGMTLFRSYADDMLLMDWLQNKIWPAEAKIEDHDIYWGSMLAIAEMLKTGTTTFADMYFHMPEVAKAVEQTGIRAVLARGMAGIAPNAEEALVESEAFYNEFNGAVDGRITVMLGPHAPYTCPPPYLKRVVALAHKLGAQIHIHLAETKGEVETCLKEYGKSPIALMDELGVLDCGVLAAHCVHLTAADIELMSRKKVRVAHNPGSNMKLASGVAPVPQLLSAGVCVGLGTDGTASNNNLDMLEEVMLAATLHKVNTLDPLAVPAKTAVSMATSDGAKALSLDHSIGKIAVGYQADITLLDTHKLHWYPKNDRISLLTYSARGADVDTVLVDGKILLDKGQFTTIDEERLMYEVQTRGMRLIS